MTFSPCGVDGWDNTKQGCKPNYATFLHVTAKTLDEADGPTKRLTLHAYLMLYIHHCSVYVLLYRILYIVEISDE